MKENDKHDLLLRSCKKAYRKGRGTAAHIIDSAAALLLFAILVWLAARTRIANTSAALLLTAACVALCAAIVRIASELRFESFVKRLREETRRKVSERKAALNYPRLCESISDKSLYLCRSIEALTADDISAANRLGCKVIVSIAAPTEQAKKLLMLTGIEVKSPFELDIKYDNGLTDADESEIDEAIIQSQATKKARGLKAVLSNLKELGRERAFRYLFTGAMLILLSFAVKYRIYYRLIGSACLAAGSAILTYGTIKSRAAAYRKGGE